MKTVERARARLLRSSEGRSIKDIARTLGVSRSSVSRWVRDIELTPDQHEALRLRNPIYNRQLAGTSAVSARCRDMRRSHQQHGRELARRGDPIHAAGCMLYWAEGAKERNQVHFTNSDPEMMRFFGEFLRRYFPVHPDDFRVTCHLFADHRARQREIERFWLETLDLPESCLRRSIVNVYSRHSKKKRQNRLPYGTCRLVVSRTSVVQSLYGSIQEYAGFERPHWLD